MARKKRPKINLSQSVQPQSGELEKLFTTDEDVEQASGLQLMALRIDAVQPDPDQPRNTFPEESLEELSESIRQDGVIQPIEVTEIRPNQYKIVHGERRWRAAQMAGLETIPAVVRRRDYDEITRFVRQLVENIQREDLNDVDRAFGMVRLRSLMQEELNAKLAQGKGTGKPHSKTVSWTDVSKRLGFSRQRASQLIQLLDLPDEIKEAVRQGLISERNTRVLRGLKPSQQRALYRALEAEDVDLDEYKEVAGFLKEAPEKTVHQAIRILRQPPPSPAETEPEFDSSFAQDESAEPPTEQPASPSETALRSEKDWVEETDLSPNTTSVDSVKRLGWVRSHLARIERRGLSRDERREILRLLKLIQQDVASLITALESEQ